MPIDSLKGKSVLVTGGAGFIGSHVVRALLVKGCRVRVLDNFSTGRRSNLEGVEGPVEILEGDIRDTGACREACQGVELVSHQAALGSVPRSVKDPATSIAVNVSGTANLFAAARDAGTSRVVYASSSSVYGDSAKLPKREGEEGSPLSPYAMTKSVCEQLAAVFTRCYGMEMVGLRYFNVYGSRQDPEGPYAAVIPRFFKAFLNGSAPVVYGDGSQTRDFTYVEDVVRANLLALRAGREACGRAYNIAGGKPCSVNDLASAIASLCGMSGTAPVHEPPRPGDVAHSTACLMASAGIGFSPSVVLEEGLRLSLPYYSELFGRK